MKLLFAFTLILLCLNVFATLLVSPGKNREASEMEDIDPPESPLQSLNDAAGGSGD